MIKRALFILVMVVMVGPLSLVIGYNIGATDIHGCIENLKKECRPLYNHAMWLKKENARLEEINASLMEDVIRCWRDEPMNPHIRGGRHIIGK
jgi:hypothetical protein